MYHALYIHFGKLISRQLSKIVTVILLSTFGTVSVYADALSTSDRFNSAAVLADTEKRISKEFHIPEKMKERTAFWFEVYTQYGSNQHIVHHTLYPWIVFKLIDTEEILSAPVNRWVKYHKSVKHVKMETQKVRDLLKRLAQRKHYKNLSPEERIYFSQLKEIKGSRRQIFKEALSNLRVQLGQKDFFVSGLTNSKRYLPAIEETFRQQNLPTELARLPFVESSFNVEAESKVGASGIWQIMPATGKHYLIVNPTIDERNSPLKATLAAAQIFKSNYRSLKQWPLAITAYNHGTTGVRRALKASETNNLPDLIDNYHQGSFRFASANFYACFLAALHAEKYSAEIFKDTTIPFSLPIHHRIVKIERPTRVEKILRQTGLTQEEFIKYNLDLKRAVKTNTSLPSGYRVILPAKASS